MTESHERRTFDRELGVLSTKVEGLEAWVEDISADVKAIRSTQDQQRGGWKALAVVGAIAGTVGAMLVKFIPSLKE